MADDNDVMSVSDKTDDRLFSMSDERRDYLVYRCFRSHSKEPCRRSIPMICSDISVDGTVATEISICSHSRFDRTSSPSPMRSVRKETKDGDVCDRMSGGCDCREI